MNRLRYVTGGSSLAYDPAKCRGCRKCAEVCPHAVFRMNGKKAELASREYCIECGACMVNCAYGAITVQTGPGCAAAVIGSLVQGGKKPACCG
jgi:NAD-dependent dihydropyrimidine dehydrogenase PreA subunit